MDIKELEEWLKTNEGIQWADSLKSGLVNKRDELLAALKEANGKLAEENLRFAAAQKSLEEERAALSSVLIDKELARLLKGENVFETVIPGTVQALKESYGITVKADGPNRLARGMIKGDDGTEKESDLTGIVSSWIRTPEAKRIVLNTNNGGGASGNEFKRDIPAPNKLGGLSGRSLAAMSDDEFRNMRTMALNNAKE